MSPYYDDGTCVIYHGDCREVLPSLSANVVLTDPPYGVDLDYDDYSDSLPALETLIAETYPLLRSAAPVVALTPGIVNLARWPHATWCLAWTWPHTGSTGKWGFTQWGPILVYGTDPYLTLGKGRQLDLIVCDASDSMAQGHPCPKPLHAWSRILMRVSPSATDVVLDPFMGSGTTLRAAKNYGRRAIGVEVSERYCELAARRLGQEVLALEAS